MKIACVVQRFGAEIAGGSEGHCLRVAQHLAVSHEVTVFTTCAKDHVTWRNEFAPGVSTIGQLTVERYPVVQSRSAARFAAISDAAFVDGASDVVQEAWFRENGPESPALVDAIAARGRTFERILFWSYRYYQTYFGLPRVADRAVLVPTAEDDPVVRFDVLDRFFALPSAFIFLTPEEQALVARRTSRPLAPSCIAGCGLDPAPPIRDAAEPLARAGLKTPFALYVGRIEASKGCDTLLRYFARCAERRGGAPVPLVMAGPATMPLPDAPWLRTLGYVDNATRDALLASASMLVMPSPYESLSLVLLEAWNHARPAIVNGRCAVLKGQAMRSNAALYYRNFDEFAEALAWLAAHPKDGDAIGACGREYVEREYRWPIVMGRIEGLLHSLPAPRSETAPLAASSAPA